jgi:hypothetical protein
MALKNGISLDDAKRKSKGGSAYPEAPKTAMAIGRCSGGKKMTIIRSAAGIVIPAPMPWRARRTIKVLLLETKPRPSEKTAGRRGTSVLGRPDHKGSATATHHQPSLTKRSRREAVSGPH